MDRITSNSYSHLTAKERDSISYPARVLKDLRLLQGKLLDFGCGLGTDVSILQKDGFDIIGYDKHYFPHYPIQKFDTILCIYVLNVLLPEEQSNVLAEVSSLLKAGGKAYFAVRRDIRYEGFRTHKVHNLPTYQCIVKLPFKSIFTNHFCEIYEYQHYTELYAGNSSAGPFLLGTEKRELIAETATAFSFFDKFPVNPGHALVVPKRVVSNYFDLSSKEQFACWLLVSKVKMILDRSFKPDGFNVGLNINPPAGQTIEHCHIHIIPRYSGDVQYPRGGIRGVIPDKKEY